MVKTFGQTVFSFKKFKGTIDNYERWVIAYTKQLRWPMTFYTLAVNSVFVFLIAGGFPVRHGGTDGGVLLNLLFTSSSRRSSPDADQADVYERERHDCAGRHHPH